MHRACSLARRTPPTTTCDKAARDWANAAFPDGIEEISFEGRPEDIQERLDAAILGGLAHRKVLMVRESGAVVKFGYKPEDLI